VRAAAGVFVHLRLLPEFADGESQAERGSDRENGNGEDGEGERRANKMRSSKPKAQSSREVPNGKLPNERWRLGLEFGSWCFPWALSFELCVSPVASLLRFCPR